VGRTKEALVFFREFIKHPGQLGSIIPSSGFLRRRILRAADLRSANVVIELGPGNGGTTRAILDAMAPDGRLLAIELNDGLVELVRQIDDPRLIVHHGDALELPQLLQQHGLAAPDVIVSGIPFSIISVEIGQQILASIYTALVDGGRFVAYQVADAVNQRSILHPGSGFASRRFGSGATKNKLRLAMPAVEYRVAALIYYLFALADRVLSGLFQRAVIIGTDKLADGRL